MKCSRQGFTSGWDGKESACNAEYLGSILGSGRSTGEGNGNPLQRSCLKNPMERGAWWATVHRCTNCATNTHTHTTYTHKIQDSMWSFSCKKFLRKFWHRLCGGVPPWHEHRVPGSQQVWEQELWLVVTTVWESTGLARVTTMWGFLFKRREIVKWDPGQHV